MSKKNILIGIVVLAVMVILPAVNPLVAVQLGQAHSVGAWHGSTSVTVDCNGWHVDVNTTWNGHPGSILESSNLSGTWSDTLKSADWSVKVGWPTGETWSDAGSVSQPEGCEEVPPPPPPCDEVKCVPQDPQEVFCNVSFADWIYSVKLDDVDVEFTQFALNNLHFTDGELMASHPVLDVVLKNGAQLTVEVHPGLDYSTEGYAANNCHIVTDSGWTPGFVPAPGGVSFAVVREVIPCPAQNKAIIAD